jgi:hypothetical protein
MLLPHRQPALLEPLTVVVAEGGVPVAIGVLLQVERTPDGSYAWVGNGVDFLTGTALRLTNGNILAYAAGAVGVTLVLLALILVARRSSDLHPRLFGPVIAESTVYAVFIAGVIGYVVDAMGLGVLDSQSLVTQIVSSCGAGLHEELVFRMGLFHCGGYLLDRRMHPKLAWISVGVLTSALFAFVHYIGPLGDKFSLASFAFRFFIGLALAAIYRFRGFAIAAWTHTLYDVLYFVLKRL